MFKKITTSNQPTSLSYFWDWIIQYQLNWAWITYLYIYIYIYIDIYLLIYFKYNCIYKYVF